VPILQDEEIVGYLMMGQIVEEKNRNHIEACIRKAVESDELYEHLNSKLCENINTTRTKLYQIFADELGMGVSTYVRERRLKKAKELLKTTNDSISDIALSVGFSDYNYFTRVFKKQFGMSPYAYRQQ
jgi:AraC-like DNA-binding protein